MCKSLNVAVNKCINWCFVHLFIVKSTYELVWIALWYICCLSESVCESCLSCVCGDMFRCICVGLFVRLCVQLVGVVMHLICSLPSHHVGQKNCKHEFVNYLSVCLCVYVYLSVSPCMSIYLNEICGAHSQAPHIKSPQIVHCKNCLTFHKDNGLTVKFSTKFYWQCQILTWHHNWQKRSHLWPVQISATVNLYCK